MYSLNIDYLFNRIYDVLLFIKYTWLFSLLRNDPQAYLDAHKNRTWDGLRDRGWFDEYLAAKDAAVPSIDTHMSFLQQVMTSFGYKLPDSDGDGIPDVTDSSPYDANNLSKAQLKERYQQDYDFYDHIRDIFGIGPRDQDGDSVPDSYEKTHGTDPLNQDSDRDGLSDGRELIVGTDSLNNDTDKDGVLDGRDEAPLDGSVSSIGTDTDGDGVSDKIETILHMDIHKKDTDGDGIPDGMDTYPLDPNNLSQISQLDFGKSAEALHLSIQNPVLALISDFLSVLTLVIVCVLVYAATQWFITFLKGLNHFEHHFNHGDDHGHGGKKLHMIRDVVDEMPAGIVNLPIFENAPVAPPTPQEFKDHPKFAIIQGYMSSGSEALWRIGILEAENLLEEVLRKKGYQGNNVSEMLKVASFKTVQLAWDAHAVRNRIAHQGSEFQLTEREAKRTFLLYESVLRELKAIR